MMVLWMSTVCQVPQHAIGIERGARRYGELRHPFLPTTLCEAAISAATTPRVAIRRYGLADLFQERVEHQAGIADQADPGLDILVEMVGIEGRMMMHLGFRHGNAERGLGERAADAEDCRRLRRANFGTARGTARPLEPSESGCVSGMTTGRRGRW